jgi:hypothetical protein
MSKEIREIVNEFIEKNGNNVFTNKELIIYFNKQTENKLKDLERKLNTLPCLRYNDRLTRIETTNKILAGVFGTLLTIIALFLAFIK